MSTVNTLPSERAAIVGAINPGAKTAAAYTTGYIALKDYGRFMAVVAVGTLGSSATVNAKLTAYTDSSGSGAVDITGAAITALTQAGSDSNKQAVINLNTDTLAGGGFTHLRLTVTVGVATSDAGALVLGFDPRYSPASDTDASSVDEIVSA